MTDIKKIAVLTSGGDAPGMNAAIRSVVRTCAYYQVEVLGVYRGYQGMIENDFTPLDARSVRNLINRGGPLQGLCISIKNLVFLSWEYPVLLIMTFMELPVHLAMIRRSIL